MKSSILILLLSVMPFILFAQDQQITITVEDADGRSQELVLGESDEATEGLDAHLGEYNLPPLPPSTAFDARWLVPEYEGFHIDYRPVLSETHTRNNWTMRIQTSDEFLPMTVSWEPSELWDGFFDLLDEATSGEDIMIDMKEEGLITISESSSLNLIIKHRFTQVLSKNYSRDWNMISLPVVPDDQAVSDFFPTSDVFVFTANGYQSSSNLPLEEGFWVYLQDEYVLEIEGEPLLNNSISVEEGWNVIGAFPDSVSIDNLTTEPDELAASFFFTYDQGYVIVEDIEPGTGYWYKATTDGEILLSNEGSAKTIAESGNPESGNRLNSKVEDLLSTWNTLKFTDVAGRSGYLLFGDEEQLINDEQQNLYHLPPRPPLNAFDVRYADNKMLAVLPGVDIDAVKRTIELQSNQFPVEITWDVDWTDSSIGLLMTDSSGDSELIMLDETGSISIGSDITHIALAGKDHVDTGIRHMETPNSFALKQNYPNPFNPTTTIRYALPETTMTRISVYDMYGRLVSNLVNDTRPAGKHSVDFDGSNLASGSYFYRIDAGSFTDTKAMMLVK